MSSKIKIEEIFPNIYVLIFDSRYELCMSFVRMQEYYESPFYRNKVFTLQEYKKYWCKNFGHGKFTYPHFWNGFNMPIKISLRWEKLFGDKYGKFSPRERELLKAIHKCNPKGYLIGVHTSGGSYKDTLNHEVAHAMYYLSSEYRRSCKRLIGNLSVRMVKKAKTKLKKLGYCSNVMVDEMQAYFSTSAIGLGHEGLEGKRVFFSNFNRFMKR
jgi:ATP-dependent helicase/DNAse subunit B